MKDGAQHCEECGESASAAALFCAPCGGALRPAAEVQVSEEPNETPTAARIQTRLVRRIGPSFREAPARRALVADLGVQDRPELRNVLGATVGLPLVALAIAAMVALAGPPATPFDGFVYFVATFVAYAFGVGIVEIVLARRHFAGPFHVVADDRRVLVRTPGGRRVLEVPDLQAVRARLVGAPDHWRCELVRRGGATIPLLAGDARIVYLAWALGRLRSVPVEEHVRARRRKGMAAPDDPFRLRDG